MKTLLSVIAIAVSLTACGGGDSDTVEDNWQPTWKGDSCLKEIDCVRKNLGSQYTTEEACMSSIDVVNKPEDIVISCEKIVLPG